jgi:cystathionine beta-lyase
VDEQRFFAFIDGLQLFGRGYSWGGYESLLIPVFAERTAVPLTFNGPLFRIAAGLEAPDDLIEDLTKGFARLRGSR